MPRMTLIANARMYSVTPAAAAAWRAMFEGVARKAGVALEVVDCVAPETVRLTLKKTSSGRG